MLQSLLEGSIGRLYQRAVDRAEAGTEGRLRVRLWIDEDAAELHAVPWERLHHVRLGRNLPVSVSDLTPFSRYTGVEAGEPEQLPTRPVHVLFAVSNPTGLPPGLRPLDVDREIRALHRALGPLADEGELRVTVLPGRTGISADLRRELLRSGYAVEDDVTGLDPLTRLLPEHEVVHFVGHGHFRRDSARGQGRCALYLEEPAGGWNAVADDDLVDRIVGTHPRSPYLVFLSACESGRQEGDGTHPFVGLGPKLVAAGVPAVVGMQAPVPVPVARELTTEFYRSLVAHGWVDVALNRARLHLYDRDEVDWAIPVLFTRLREGRLFVPSRLANKVRTEDVAIEQTQVGARADRVAAPDRPTPRRRPIRALPRDFPDLIGREKQVAVASEALGGGRPVQFFGERGAGKTSLLRHLAHRPVPAVEGVVHGSALGKPVEDLLQYLFDRLYLTDGSYKPTPGQLRELIEDVKVLFALDDAELSREEAQRLLDAAPQALFLLTAREPSLVGECEVVPLEGLDPDAGATLFERHLGRPLAEDERAHALALSAVLRGSPGEIVRAAARVAHEGLTVREVLAEEEDRRATEPAPGLGAHEAAALPPEDRRAVAALAAVGDAPISSVHLAEVLGDPDVHSRLDRLEQVGLAKAGSPTFTLAQEPDAEADEYLHADTWRARLLAHFIEWCELHRDDPGRIIGSIDPILAILAWARTSGRLPEFLRLARLVEEALIVGRRWGTWRTLLRQELDAAAATGDEGARAWALHQLGTQALGQKRKRAARRQLKEAFRLRKRLGDREGARLSRHNLKLLPLSLLPPFLTVTFVATVALATLVAPLLLTGPAIGVTAEPAEVAFGEVALGSREVQRVTLSPTGEAPVVIEVIHIDPPVDDFRVRRTDCGGPLRGSCEVVVVFVPDAAGPTEATLVITYNGPQSPKGVPLSGAGRGPPGEPAVALAPDALEFDRVVLGESRELPVTVTNEGDGDLTVDDVAIEGGPFRVVAEDCRAGPVAPGEACSVTVRFSPTERGPFEGRLVLRDDAEGSPHRVPLSGFGAVNLPDLIVPELRANGEPSFGPRGEVLVPVAFLVANGGDVPAAPFKISMEYAVPRGTFVAHLVADAGDRIRPEPPYAFTVDELSWLPGEDRIAVTGTVVFGSALQGATVQLFARADSCAGDEFIPPEVCRVAEIAEGNNLSPGLTLVLPQGNAGVD